MLQVPLRIIGITLVQATDASDVILLRNEILVIAREGTEAQHIVDSTANCRVPKISAKLITPSSCMHQMQMMLRRGT